MAIFCSLIPQKEIYHLRIFYEIPVSISEKENAGNDKEEESSDDDDEDNLPWEWYDWNFDVPNVDDVDHIFWKMVDILRTKYPNYPLIELVTDAVLSTTTLLSTDRSC